MITHSRIVGDIYSPLGAQLKKKSSDGTYDAVNVTNLTVKFKMVDNDGVTKVALTSSNITKIDLTNGKVQYDFKAADVDTPGIFWAWFVTEDGSNEQDTFPADGRTFRILIYDSEGDTGTG